MIERFADEFGKVSVYGVPGNHGKNTQKPYAKSYALMNFDWVIGSFIEMHFTLKGDDRVTVTMTDNQELHFEIYNHRYRLTHGHQYRSSSSLHGPVKANEAKDKMSYASYGKPYDTLVLGHFHHLQMTMRTIINGSVVGFSEFAAQERYEYERPQQALWITHPEYGITYNIPVFCGL